MMTVQLELMLLDHKITIYLVSTSNHSSVNIIRFKDKLNKLMIGASQLASMSSPRLTPDLRKSP